MYERILYYEWNQCELKSWCVLSGRKVPSSDGLLAEVFLSCKANARRSVHSPRDHLIITLIISDRRDTREKWPLARNPEISWWHRHTSLMLFWPQLIAAHGQQISKKIVKKLSNNSYPEPKQSTSYIVTGFFKTYSRIVLPTVPRPF